MANIWKDSSIIQRIVAIAVIIAVIVTAIWLFALPTSPIRDNSQRATLATASSSPSSSTKTSAAHKKVTKVSKAIIDKLNPSTMSYNGPVDATGITTFTFGFAQPLPPRLWSDGLSTPLAGATPLDARSDLQSKIWADPLLGCSWANFLANQTINGVKIGDLPNNTWMKPCYTDPSEINKSAAAFVPLLNKSARDVTVKQQNAAVQKNRDYQVFAGWLNTLINNLEASNIGTTPSSYTYHLDKDGMDVGDIPAVGVATEPDIKQELTLTVSEKNSCAPALVIGANMGDSRPEALPIPSCAVTPAVHTTTTPSTPHKTTSCTSGCNTTPTKTCTAGYFLDSNGNCELSKSTNVKDYAYVAGKPAVTANPTADDKAPVVNTAQQVAAAAAAKAQADAAAAAQASAAAKAKAQADAAAAAAKAAADAAAAAEAAKIAAEAGAPDTSNAPSTCSPAPGVTC